MRSAHAAGGGADSREGRRGEHAAALREGGDAAQEAAAKQVHGGLGPAVLGEIAGRHGGDAGIEGFAGVALSAVMRQQGCAQGLERSAQEEPGHPGRPRLAADAESNLTRVRSDSGPKDI